MYEKTLPIGSVVLVKGGKKRLMIIGYCKKMLSDGKVYDYAGCLYPEGFISPDNTMHFNHDQIERIYALGYQNEQRFAFEKQLEEALKKVEKDLAEGSADVVTE